MATHRRPALPLTEALFWDAMRAKWPGGAIRHVEWLDDSYSIVEIQKALSDWYFYHGHTIPKDNPEFEPQLRMFVASEAVVEEPSEQVELEWRNPGRYDLQTMDMLRLFMDMNNLEAPDGIMTQEIYKALGLLCTELYGVPDIPQPEQVEIIETRQKVSYVTGALIGAVALYFLISLWKKK